MDPAVVRSRGVAVLILCVCFVGFLDCGVAASGGDAAGHGSTLADALAHLPTSAALRRPVAKPIVPAVPLPNEWPGGREWAPSEHDVLPTEPFVTFGLEPSFSIMLFQNEYISVYAKQKGYYGPLRKIRALLADTDGGLVVDVGANIGMVTLYAAALGHRVIAFEPLEENYRMALASVHMNQGFSSRVMLFQRAAHWGTEPLVLARNPTNTHGFRNSGCATLATATANQADSDVLANNYTVLPLAVDDVVGPTEHVNVLKVDVEGCACHVLRSARELINSMRVSAMELEMLPRDVCGCDYESDVKWLLGLGYIPLVPQDRKFARVSTDDLLEGVKHRDVTFLNPAVLNKSSDSGKRGSD